MMIKAVLFDFDGTIADTLPVSVACVNILSKKYDYSKVALSKCRDISMREAVNKYLKISMFRLPFFVKDLKELLSKHSDDIKIFDGMDKVIRLLSQRYMIGILTSNSESFVSSILNKYNLRKNVSFINSDASVFGKDMMLRKFLKKNNLRVNDVVYVGDEVRDIEACKKLKLKMIAVSWGYNSRKLLKSAKAEQIVDMPSALLSLFSQPL